MVKAKPRKKPWGPLVIEIPKVKTFYTDAIGDVGAQHDGIQSKHITPGTPPC